MFAKPHPGTVNRAVARHTTRPASPTSFAGSRPSNSFALTLLADPHPLTPIESNFYKNMGGGGLNFPISVPYFLTPIPLPHHPPKPFRMNTFKSVSKQKTLTPFRINTYEKQGGEAHFAQFWCNVSPFRINTYKSVSKQRTLTPFRMNTYEKQGGGGWYNMTISYEHSSEASNTSTFFQPC